MRCERHLTLGMRRQLGMRACTVSCTCVHDNESCTRLQNYTIGASLAAMPCEQFLRLFSTVKTLASISTHFLVYCYGGWLVPDVKYLPDISFTLTSRVIYLHDVNSQNQRMDGSEVYYEQLGYNASLISHHWILRRALLFWGDWKIPQKM